MVSGSIHLLSLRAALLSTKLAGVALTSEFLYENVKKQLSPNLLVIFLARVIITTI